MKRIYYQKHRPIPFVFRQNSEDFIVDEVPLQRDGARGSYLIVKIRKQNLSTMEMLAIFEEMLHCYTIGYAGLKDKSSTSTQYISVPLKYSRLFKCFYHPKIKIIETFRYHKKIALGDLKGNRFFIRLKEVTPESARIMEELLVEIMRYGMPNYFGYQRFGRESDNFETTRDIAHGEKLMRDKKIQKLLGNAYQSYLFNDWLAERVVLSRKIVQNGSEQYNLSAKQLQQLQNQPGIFRVLPGDIMLDKRSGKWLNVTDLQSIRKAYREQQLIPTGLLAGRKAWRAKEVAGVIERKYDDMMVVMAGSRREAWVYPKEIRSTYKNRKAFFELSFFLPKGAYATVLLENLANRELG